MAEGLSTWTLYCNPDDAPGCYVLRRFRVDERGYSPTMEAYYDGDPEPLRSFMRSRGLHCIPRSPGDPPAIVETWL